MIYVSSLITLLLAYAIEGLSDRIIVISIIISVVAVFGNPSVVTRIPFSNRKGKHAHS